jgi:hypothetical protein
MLRLLAVTVKSIPLKFVYLFSALLPYRTVIWGIEDSGKSNYFVIYGIVGKSSPPIMNLHLSRTETTFKLKGCSIVLASSLAMGLG